MNWIPARATWLLIALVALVFPKCSAAGAFRIGWQQHAAVPGPNSGWSEAAIAGAIRRRLAGPIWANGQLVTEIWIGDSSDPPAGDSGDVPRAAALTAATGLLSAAAVIAAIAAV